MKHEKEIWNNGSLGKLISIFTTLHSSCSLALCPKFQFYPETNWSPGNCILLKTLSATFREMKIKLLYLSTIVLLLTYHSKNSWPKNYLQSPALGLVLPWRKCLRFERMMLYIFLNCRSSRPFRGSSLKSSSLRLASWLLVLVMRDKKYVIEGLVSCPQWRIVTLRAL